MGFCCFCVGFGAAPSRALLAFGCGARSREGSSRFEWGMPHIPHAPRGGRCRRRRLCRRGFFWFVGVERRGTLACAPRLRLRCSLEGGFVAVRVGDASHPPRPQRRTLSEETSLSSWVFLVCWRGSERHPRMRSSPSAAVLARGRVRRGSSGGCLTSPTPPEADIVGGEGFVVVGFSGLLAWSGGEPSHALLAFGCGARSREGSAVFEWGMPHIPHAPRGGRCRRRRLCRRGFSGLLAWSGGEPSRALLAFGCGARSREGSTRFEWGMPHIPHAPRSGRWAPDAFA